MRKIIIRMKRELLVVKREIMNPQLLLKTWKNKMILLLMIKVKMSCKFEFKTISYYFI